MKKYDVIFVGAGPAGYSAAALLSGAGKKVAIIERKDFGGTCVNEGCIPTKTLLKSAKVFNEVKHANKYGILVKGEIKFDFDQIQHLRLENKKKLNGAIEGALKGANVEIFHGVGNVVTPSKIEVNGQVLETEKIVLATGAKSREIAFDGKEDGVFDGVIVNSTGLLTSKTLPATLTIIGGGPVALEFAYFAASLGTKVTILEYAPTLLSNFDPLAGEQVKKLFEALGVKIVNNVTVDKYQDGKLWYKANDVLHSIKSEKILLATGRVCNIEAFSNVGVELNPNGSVKVNNKMETSIKNIYAIGDVTGALMLTTTAYKQGDVLIQNLLGKEIEEFNPQNFAWSIYFSPELAGAGLNKKQAVEKYGEEDVIEVKLNDFELPRNHADSKIDFGFIKLLIQKKTGRVLGSLMLLDNASILINEIALALANKLTVWDMAKAGHTHPTLAEALYYITRKLSIVLNK